MTSYSRRAGLLAAGVAVALIASSTAAQASNSNRGHKSRSTIAAIACSTDPSNSGATGFSDLCTAVNAVGLYNALNSKRKMYTVFAPTNQAFQDLCNALDDADVTQDPACAMGSSAGDIVALLGADASTKLTNVVKYHVIRGRQFSNSLFGKYDKTRKTLYKCGDTAKRLTFEGSPRSARTAIITTGGAQTVTVTAANIKARKGVIHVVDKVMLPNALTCS